MSWKVERESTVCCSVEDFYSGLDVWIQRPQVVNRRVLGCVEVYRNQISHEPLDHVSSSKLQLFEGCLDDHLSAHLRSIVEYVLREGVFKGHIVVRKMLPRMKNMVEGLEAVIVDEDHHSMTFCPLVNEPSTTVPVGSYRLQLVTSHDKAKIVLYTWVPQTPHILAGNGVTTPTLEWLKSVLLPKVSQWSMESASHKPVHKGNSLVPLSRYAQLYRDLKHKYGEPLVMNWPEATDPHKFVYEDIAIATYLLILWELEREELNLEHRQSFIDLGCGNGLLVYLLTAEGHPGKGIDLRERKIWKRFRENATLEVCTLTPSDETLYPNYDWLLGNHSDELTPWIPVMAARSSYTTRYFVLPCCPHDFETKYRRRGSDKSQYRSYLDYVQEIGETMGFKVQEDTMRIPSSKRICHIGRVRSYPESEEVEVDKRRMDFLDQRCPSRALHSTGTPRNGQNLTPRDSETATPKDCQTVTPKGSQIATPRDCQTETPRDNKTCSEVITKDTSTSRYSEVGNGPHHRAESVSEEAKWASGFQPRSSTEHVRNCSLVYRDVRALVVKTLSDKLLKTENFTSVRTLRKVQAVSECSCDAVRNDDVERVHEDLSTTFAQWNCGGKLPLSEAVSLMDPTVLQKLKNEFGGLQTLLRNEHQVFQVYGGCVQLRNWAELEQPKRSKRSDRRNDASLLRKTKACWFFHSHPQGCPRTDIECPYAHGMHERRKRPEFALQGSLC